MGEEVTRFKELKERLVGEIKRDFTQLFKDVLKQVEDYPIVFKAIVDSTGRITIPLAERKSNTIIQNNIVQVKMKVVPTVKDIIPLIKPKSE